MANPKLRAGFFGSVGLLTLIAAWHAQAGGSGLNTAVIINQTSSNSLELGNYYCERRLVPAENVLRINWSGGNTSWTVGDFQTNLLGPLRVMLANRQLTNQIDYVVLSMDIPYQTIGGTAINSTTSALFYGFKDDSGPDWLSITNSYGASEESFARAKPASAPGYAFLATMITSDTLARAKHLVDQGVNSDGTFPVQPVLLAKSTDSYRNIRYHAFDNAIFNGRLGRSYSMTRTNCDGFWGRTNLLGVETGLYQFAISPNAFVPGAMADSLTSYGGLIFSQNDQTTLLAFINAGAAGSYGTVTEPSPNAEKFPDPQNYFYQGRGFSLAECYYQSLLYPYQGLIVGEPLAAPYQSVASGRWTSPSSNAVLSGAAALSLEFSAHDAQRPLSQIDLFVDGKYFRTLTNLPPTAGNVLNLSLNGYSVRYTVPAAATLSSIAMGLAAALNAGPAREATKTIAFPHGDRIELHSVSTNRLGDPFFFTDTGNVSGPNHYYRIVALPQMAAPALSARGPDGSGSFGLHVEPPTGVPYVLQASADLAQWTNLATNAAGSAMDYLDGTASNAARRFYRTLVLPPAGPEPILTTVEAPGRGRAELRIDGALSPYILQVSSDQVHWSGLVTNFAVGKVVSAANSLMGTGGMLSTFLTPSRNSFLESSAYGLRSFSINGTLQSGAYLQINVAKTTGGHVAIAVTNLSSGATMFDFTRQLVNAINSSPELQGLDGLAAEDFMLGWFGAGQFNLRARSPGDRAASLRARISGSSSLAISPGYEAGLDQNIADLQPRNHLYVSAGATNLALAFVLDTTALADGFHELTAIAYEGTHVHTQTPLTLSVTVQNSALRGTTAFLDLPDPAPVGGVYHIQIAALTNNVSSIRLFSTGGLLAVSSNQSTATFTVTGQALGIGHHPFYALIDTTTGQKYRTEPRWARFR